MSFGNDSALNTSAVNPTAIADTIAHSSPVSDFTLMALGELACVIIVVGVPGNALVILSVCFNKHLRSAPNLLVLSLSVCDFTFLTFLLPFHAFTMITGQRLNPNLCWAVGFLTSWCVGSSVLSTGAIALNRYVAIVLNNRYKYFSGTKTVIVTCSFVYLLPFAIVSPAFDSRVATFAFDPVDRQCGWYNSDLVKTVFIACLGVLPLIFMTICYILIFCNVIASRKRVDVQAPGHAASSTQGNAEAKLSLMLSMVYVVYLVTTFPDFILHTLAQVGAPISLTTLTVSFVCVWCSTAINPILYGLVNKNYRNAYRGVAKKVTSVFRSSETRRVTYSGN